MVQKGQQAIPVYDLDTLHQVRSLPQDLMAERFATYLEVHPNLHLPHRHTFYHILLFTQGSGTHTIDFEPFGVTPGQIYFMVPGQVHSWNFEGEVDGYVINFTEELLRSFLSKQHYPELFPFFRGIAAESVFSLPEPGFGAACGLMEQIIRETHSRAAMHLDLASAYLVAFLITVLRYSPVPQAGETAGQNQVLLHHFRKLVEQYYTEKHLPKEYAELLYVTPNHLNALCKDLLNKPAGTVIRDRILLEAKRLLVNAGLNISEIAYRLHFSDNSYFTKFFKKYTGQTPDEFRKSSLGLTSNSN